VLSTAHSNERAPFDLKVNVGVAFVVERAPTTLGAGGGPATRPTVIDRRVSSLINEMPRVASL
jgi:hypothetical protein